jgi:hypothetical protein
MVSAYLFIYYLFIYLFIYLLITYLFNPLVQRGGGKGGTTNTATLPNGECLVGHMTLNLDH